MRKPGALDVGESFPGGTVSVTGKGSGQSARRLVQIRPTPWFRDGRRTPQPRGCEVRPPRREIPSQNSAGGHGGPGPIMSAPKTKHLSQKANYTACFFAEQSEKWSGAARTWWARAHHVRAVSAGVLDFVMGGGCHRGVVASASHHEILTPQRVLALGKRHSVLSVVQIRGPPGLLGDREERPDTTGQRAR